MKKQHKNTIIFYEIHPVNYLFAFFLSFFRKVVYWRKSVVPLFFLNRFEQIYLHNSFTQGEWVCHTANIFFRLKKIFPNYMYTDRVSFKCCNNKIDMTSSAMQRIVMKYERVKHFSLLIDYWLERQSDDINYSIVGFTEKENLVKLGLVNENKKHLTAYAININFDFLWESVLNFFLFAVQIKRLLLSVFKSRDESLTKEIKFYWYCIPPSEVPYKDGSNNVTAMINRKLMKTNESLFIFQNQPNKMQQSWLSKNKIKWIYYKNIGIFLPRKYILKYTVQLLLITVGAYKLSGNRSLTRQVKPLLIRDILMLNNFLNIDASVLITGQSCGILESPIVSVVRSLNKKTVFWMYSGVGTKHIPCLSKFKYKNEQLEGSITLSEYKYVWNKLDKIMLENRNITPSKEQSTNVKIMGSVMSGNSMWMSKKPYKARIDYKFKGSKKCKKWISVFDLPTFKDYFHTEYRWPIGGVSRDMQSEFFSGINNLLNDYPDIGIIYKPKRPLHGDLCKNFFHGNELDKLTSLNNVWHLSRRLVVLPFDVDPYIPISLCDFAIVMPYSSVLLAVLSANRKGVYYDPTSSVNLTYPTEINEVTINNKKDLYEKIDCLLMGADIGNDSLIDLIKYKRDPGVNFSSHLNSIK
jgi:polysaccharide biosynthesis PFTS motif protein